MSIEKRGDSLWKEGLDRLDSVPDQEPLEKGQAWDKLYEQLGKQKRRRRYSPYWVAAACVLFLLMAVIGGIPVGSRFGKTAGGTELVVKTIVKKSGDTTHMAGEILRSSDLSIVRNNEPYPVWNVARDRDRSHSRNQGKARDRNHVGSRKYAGDRKHIRGGDANIVSKAVLVPLEALKEPATITSAVLPRYEGALPGVASMPVKRNLAVVPLNESIFSTVPHASFGDDPAPHSFRFKLYNPAKLPLPALAVEDPAAGPIIKIQLSAQN